MGVQAAPVHPSSPIPAVSVSATLPLELLGDVEGPRDGRSEPHQVARALVVDGPQALHGLVFSRRGISRQSGSIGGGPSARALI
jgi:hypothetical protein